MYEKSIRSAMKLSPSVTPRGSLRFMAVLVMCCTIVIHISAMDETPEAKRPGEDPNSNQMSSDGAETVEKQSLLYRGRRTVKKNATPNLPDMEKRLKAVEERYAAIFCCSRRSYPFSKLPLIRRAQLTGAYLIIEHKYLIHVSICLLLFGDYNVRFR